MAGAAAGGAEDGADEREGDVLAEAEGLAGDRTVGQVADGRTVDRVSDSLARDRVERKIG